MWRGIAIIILLIMFLTDAVTFFIDRDQHSKDNSDRASAWQELKDGVRTNRAMIMKNYDAIIRNSEDVRELRAEVTRCSSCHGHKNGTPLVQRRPVN